jgi:pSer/pThr/pTyr-binding forkhead associated (FHA) protein
MVTAVRLTVLTGPHKGCRFCFCGPTRCEIGRALDCFIELSGAEKDQLISRHHCQLDIDPPSVQVRDLGSTNGTYLNGRGVDVALKQLSEKAGAVVGNGDLLTVGGTTLQVDIVACPHAESGSEGQAAWQGVDTARKDCTLPCPEPQC